MKTYKFFLLVLILFPLRVLPLPVICGGYMEEIIVRFFKGGEKLEVGKSYWHPTEGEVTIISVGKNGTAQVRLSNGEIRYYDEETAATLKSCDEPLCS